MPAGVDCCGEICGRAKWARIFPTFTSSTKTLVVNSRLNSSIYTYSLPDLKLIGGVEVGNSPDWVTLTPDGKTAYVANAASDTVSVVDIANLKQITQIRVGQVPKRNTTVILP